MLKSAGSKGDLESSQSLEEHAIDCFLWQVVTSYWCSKREDGEKKKKKTRKTLSAYRCSGGHEIAAYFCVIQRPVWDSQWNQRLVAQQFKNRGLNIRHTVDRHNSSVTMQ